jgi:hypothetical protein
LHDDREEATAAVWAASQPSEVDAAGQVFNELTQVRLATLRAPSLLQNQRVQFSGDRSRVISGLCESSKAAIDFIHDLAPGPFTALNDEALRAFLDESGEAGMTGSAWTDRRPGRTPSTC